MKYLRNVIVLQEKSESCISGMRKLNRKQERKLVCGFVACLRVLIFAVIGHNTINIPEIFQVWYHCKEIKSVKKWFYVYVVCQNEFRLK